MKRYIANITRVDYDYLTFEETSLAKARVKAEKMLIAYNDNMLSEEEHCLWEITSVGRDDD